jgi:hypothetical protein
MKCRVCGTKDKNKPMCFRMTDACCERHRKLIVQEEGIHPTIEEWVTMDRDLFEKCEDRWLPPKKALAQRAKNFRKGI